MSSCNSIIHNIPICIHPFSRIKIWAVETRLKELLALRKKQRIADARRVPAAVLIPLYKKRGQYYIVFIKRTETVKDHKGQISFPGGARDNKDKTLLDTAIRECAEEIGIQPADIAILGELDDEITTTSNYIVTPFVAMIPWPYQFTINQAEVDEIIEAPLSCLLDKNCLRPNKEILNGKALESYAYHYQDKVIWGATARILNKLLGMLETAMAGRY